MPFCRMLFRMLSKRDSAARFSLVTCSSHRPSMQRCPHSLTLTAPNIDRLDQTVGPDKDP